MTTAQNQDLHVTTRRHYGAHPRGHNLLILYLKISQGLFFNNLQIYNFNDQGRGLD